MTEFDLKNVLMAYENGDLLDSSVTRLFAYLIKTGKAWELPDHFAERATGFIKAGVIDEFGVILIELEIQ